MNAEPIPGLDAIRQQLKQIQIEQNPQACAAIDQAEAKRRRKAEKRLKDKTLGATG